MSAAGLSSENGAVRRLLGTAKLEILPLRSVVKELAALEPGMTLAVTASPAKGLEASIALGSELRAAGFEVVVHVAARMVGDRAHLTRLLDAMDEGGIDRAFVVGGDAASVGDYPDALALLRDLADLGRRPRELGIGCHPQGHPLVASDVLLAALRDKAPYADYMTSQLCFDADALRNWLAARRAEGLDLPIDVGIPGPVDPARLIRISGRIGVRDAARFVARHRGLVARLLRTGGYRPDRLLRDMAPMLADPAASVRGLHIFTFNQVERTEGWRRAQLA